MGDDPARISGILGGLARGWGIDNPAETARIFAGWERIVGPEVATRCRPTSLKGGVLRVRTESAVWASEFRYLAAEVVERINRDLGSTIVREIKPWVKPGVGENGAMSPRSEPASHATTRGNAQMAKQAAEVARGVQDPALSEALKKAFLAAKISQAEETGMLYSKGSPSATKAPSQPRFKPSKQHR